MSGLILHFSISQWRTILSYVSKSVSRSLNIFYLQFPWYRHKIVYKTAIVRHKAP